MGRVDYPTSRDDVSGNGKGLFILFVVLVVGVVLAAFLLYYLHNKRGNLRSIVLERDGEVNTTLKVDDINLLVPGDTSEYSFEVDCREAGTFSFEFHFIGNKATPLGPYVTVEIFVENERMDSATLGALLAGDTLIIQQQFNAETKGKMTVRYTLIENVGNEAQGATLDFDLRLVARKVG